MHTCMVQWYHETLHISYHSNSEINILSVNFQNVGSYNTTLLAYSTLVEPSALIEITLTILFLYC